MAKKCKGRGAEPKFSAGKAARAALGLLREAALIVAVVTVLQVGLVQAYHVPTGSMETTILAGDFLLADKVTLGPRTPQWIGVPGTEIGVAVPALKLPGLRAPERGDIVVVEVPVDERTPYVKRVVALGGDTVQVRGKRLFVNGAPAPEPAGLVHRDPLVFPEEIRLRGMAGGGGNRDHWGPFVVPEDHLFLMGDNRDNSLDSRWFGPVARSAVVGRARMVTISWDASTPGLALWERLRLDRFGRWLR